MQTYPSLGDRILVVGSTGSGKTTLARRLADRLGCVHTELDGLNWEANWTAAPVARFRERVQEATKGDRWVTDGNYSAVRDLLWSAADTLVWLDYPLPVVFWRLLLRTLRRTLRQEELWNGNRERFSHQFFSRHSLFLWLFRTHFRRRRDYVQLLQRPEYQHLRLIHHRSPKATERWLATQQRSPN